MQQKITAFHLDHENHWVADLACGHAQHVRHEPPFQPREWVTTEAGRNKKLGAELNCKRCDEMGAAIVQALIPEIKKSILQGYTDAGLSGLCDEGRLEAALGELDSLPIQKILQTALIPVN